MWSFNGFYSIYSKFYLFNKLNCYLCINIFEGFMIYDIQLFWLITLIKAHKINLIKFFSVNRLINIALIIY